MLQLKEPCFGYNRQRKMLEIVKYQIISCQPQLLVNKFGNGEPYLNPQNVTIQHPWISYFPSGEKSNDRNLSKNNCIKSLKH